MTKININYEKQSNQEQSLGKASPERTKMRPVSPHIAIYKWEWTMIYSIMHRISAVGVGVIMLTFLLSGLLLPFTTWSDLSFFQLFEDFFLIKIYYAASVFCIAYYIFATIKYLLWGRVIGLDLQRSKWLGHSSLIATILFTAGVLYNAIIL